MELIDRDTAEAVDALLSLARGGPASFREIAARAEARSDRLCRILEKLRHSGIVKVTSGPDARFAVASPTEKISLLDIVRSVQGTVEVHNPSADARKEPSGISRGGLPADDVRQSIIKLLEKITLEELLESASSGLTE